MAEVVNAVINNKEIGEQFQAAATKTMKPKDEVYRLFENMCDYYGILERVYKLSNINQIARYDLSHPLLKTFKIFEDTRSYQLPGFVRGIKDFSETLNSHIGLGFESFVKFIIKNRAHTICCSA